VYLASLAGDTAADRVPRYPDLDDFLEALNREFPGGCCEGSTIIPYCRENLADE
jgi:hypothetical protein